ncbi:MAG: MFS transporter [Pseudomonadota bacterium]
MQDVRADGAVTLSLKLRYAMGGAAEGAVGYAFNGFNFLIYTVVFGLPGTLAGGAVFLSIILDAVSDPLIGYLSDRWRSRWGRRHPFIYFASLPLGAAIFCIYVPPDTLLADSDTVWNLLGYEATSVQWALAGWLFVFASLLKFFLTCYHLPHLALGSELSDRYIERTRIFRYNTLFSFGGGAALAWCFYNLVVGDKPVAEIDTSWFAGILAVFGAIVIFLTAFLTRHRIPHLPQPPADQAAFTLRRFVQDASVVFQNRNYLMLFFGLFFLSPMIGVRETLGANMSLYYWEIPPSLIAFFPIVAAISYIPAMMLVAFLNERFEKGGTMRGAVALAALAASLPIIARSFDLLPANGSVWIFPLICASVFFYYGALATLTTTVYSAIGDVVDEQELRTGLRQEGIFYAVRTFFAKVANGLGHLLAGIAVDVIGFPSRAVVGEVPEQVLFELGIFEGVLAVLPVLGAVYFYGRYAIDKQRHQDILDELERARALNRAV